MTDEVKEEQDGEYAICPHCGCQHGDCWEWVTEQSKTRECGSCGKEFQVWAEYETTYHTSTDLDA